MSSSAPDRPTTWRPLGVRLAACIFGGALLVICTAAWLALGADGRARFSPVEKGTMLAVGVIGYGCLYALSRSRVTLDGDRLIVVNGFRSRLLTRQEVVAVSLSAGAPWATLDLADGTAISAMGIQGSDGDRARRAVRELRAAVEGRQQDHHPDEGV